MNTRRSFRIHQFVNTSKHAGPSSRLSRAMRRWNRSCRRNTLRGRRWTSAMCGWIWTACRLVVTCTLSGLATLESPFMGYIRPARRRLSWKAISKRSTLLVLSLPGISGMTTHLGGDRFHRKSGPETGCHSHWAWKHRKRFEESDQVTKNGFGDRSQSTGSFVGRSRVRPQPKRRTPSPSCGKAFDRSPAHQFPFEPAGCERGTHSNPRDVREGYFSTRVRTS